ncbi:unnamed protein product [Rotaria sp. Silwood1]|nr:unnamed protein product [Rotaria sp. Silwood1]CAF3485370.1 unnamed protein product [Rotaria sp. Silwood1]CAF3502070.1 unnamed protein product [Rotaria sp. Silwood1]CAF4535102.1 unnamed protein product [Rotaria sp. Silwood1]CAF4852449.1 unnamed protein product [Rotaria sp. Silwood1]
MISNNILINNTINKINHINITKNKLSSSDLSPHVEESFDLTWNDILYDGGLGTWLPRSSFRWLTISVCTIGIIGNILAVCTLLRRRMRTLSTYAYLTALCLSNSVTLLSVIIFELEIFFAPNRFNCILVSLAKSLASSTFALSTWITVGFTVDRYIMICFPFTGEKLCTRRNTLFVLILCLSLALAYLMPQILANSCHAMPNGNSYNKTNDHLNLSIDHSNYYYSNKTESFSTTFWVSGLSEIGKSLAYRLTITLFVNCFLVRIIPFLVVLKLNLHLIRTLSTTKRRHRQINPYEQKRNDVTHMLVVVISIYLVCIMPSIPFAAFFAYDPDKYVDISYHYRTFQHLDEFGKFLMIFNSASQCYLYIFFGKRFRRELARLVCCFCTKYFYMPIPQNNTNSDRDTFLQDFGNNDTYELVLSGKWSLDQRQDSLAGIEFSFHHPRRWSRLTSSSATTTHSDSDFRDNRLNFGILKSFKTRVEQLFVRFK